MKDKKVDRFFLITVLILVCFGAAMFVSASLGVLAKSEKTFYSILFSQLVLGFGAGLIGMYITFKINYKFWRKYSFMIFIASIILTMLVFVPHVGWMHGGATRWIGIGPISFQPAEILKFGFVIYFASYLSWAKNKVQNFKFGILPALAMFAVIALVLLKQPDTKSLILILITGVSMLFVSGTSLKYIFGIGGIAVVLLGSLVIFTPYLRSRVNTFINPSSDPTGSSYQFQQSLIAMGSGGIFGRGFGQSVQKFNYLPEAQGD